MRLWNTLVEQGYARSQRRILVAAKDIKRRSSTWKYKQSEGTKSLTTKMEYTLNLRVSLRKWLEESKTSNKSLQIGKTPSLKKHQSCIRTKPSLKHQTLITCSDCTYSDARSIYYIQNYRMEKGSQNGSASVNVAFIYVLADYTHQLYTLSLMRRQGKSHHNIM